MSLIERIFPGTTLAEFKSRYWLFERFHVAGDPERFQELLANPAFRDVEAAMGMRCGERRVDKPAQDGTNRVKHTFGVSPETARTELAAGNTIYIGGITEDPLPAMTAALTEELELPVALDGVFFERYWLGFAARPSKGLRWHWDRHHLLVLQLRGTKKFEVASNQFFERPLSPPAGYDSWLKGMVPPLLAALDNKRLTDADLPTRWDTLELRPGSALFMPAGTWHRAETVEDSLHIAFAVRLATLPEVLLTMLVTHPELYAQRFHLPVATMRDLASLAHDGAPLDAARRAWFREASRVMADLATGDAFGKLLQKGMDDVASGAFSYEPKD